MFPFPLPGRSSTSSLFSLHGPGTIFPSSPFFSLVLLPSDECQLPRWFSVSFHSTPEPGVDTLSSFIYLPYSFVLLQPPFFRPCRSFPVSPRRFPSFSSTRGIPLAPARGTSPAALARRPWPEFYRPTVCTYYQQPSASFTRPKDPVKRLRTHTEDRHVFLFLRRWPASAGVATEEHPAVVDFFYDPTRRGELRATNCRNRVDWKRWQCRVIQWDESCWLKFFYLFVHKFF